MNLSLFPRRPLRKTIVFSKTHKSPIKIVSGKPGSPVSASDVSKPIFEIKDTEEKKKVRSLNMEQEQEMISLKECSSCQPLKKRRSLTLQLQQSR